MNLTTFLRNRSTEGKCRFFMPISPSRHRAAFGRLRVEKQMQTNMCFHLPFPFRTFLATVLSLLSTSSPYCVLHALRCLVYRKYLSKKLEYCFYGHVTQISSLPFPCK